MSGERAPPGARGGLLRVASGLWLLVCCEVTPLTNKIRIGEEPFVIAVGEGPDSMTDLFAAPAGGGSFVRLTFNRPEERAPRLAPDGAKVAFLRRDASNGRAGWSLVVLDLRNNAEWSAPLPVAAGEPERLGWSQDGRRVVVRAGGYWSAPAPPEPVRLSRVEPAAVGGADSATRELLGEPPQGTVEPCATGGVCIVAATGEVTSLGEGVTGAVRWGPDSLGYFLPGGFEVRPLRGGRSRRPGWSALPARLRDLTYHSGGQLTTSGGFSGRR